MNDKTTTSSAGFQWRALTSVLMTLGFLMLALSGLMLFLAPPGRVANWTNWTLLGLRKSEWGGVHIWFGTLFLVMTAFHVFYNWRPLLSYFKNRVTRAVGFRQEWAVAGALTAVVFAGTKADLPPFSSFLTWNEEFKASWEKASDRAPIPHAELLTLAALAEKGGVDLPTATARLAAKGITGFTGETVVQKIADAAKLPARGIYDIIMAGTKPASGHAEGKAGGGLGWKTLTQFCADEGLSLEEVRARLKARNLKFDDTMTLREIASNNGQKPYDLVESLRPKP
ncbi:MAG: DUF4405 domain-containing protein [Verrucomicrobia bacterium]|nr:DUF4405 domain-containing protein [Verrucomicrobiota bacterium]